MTHQTLKRNLRSAGFTLPTPFTADGNAVDHNALESNINYLTEAGAELLIPCGNTGEYYSLTNAEREAVVRTTVEAAEDATVIGGIGGSTKNALSLLESYEDAGVDGVMVMYPSHTYLHEQGVRQYYERLIEATTLGVVLYKRGPRLSVDNIATLTEQENVVGVKFAQNDADLFSRTITESDGDVVWSVGVAERLVPAFLAEGAEGFTTGIGNFIPGPVLELMDAVETEDIERAREVRDVLRPYEDLRDEPGPGNKFSAGNNVPAVKYGQELAGLYGGPVREPLVELSEETKTRCRKHYEEIQDWFRDETAR